MSIEEIRQAIAELPEGERRQLYAELAEDVGGDGGPRRQLSAYDLAKGLIGSFDGPGDLSTNKAYLDDLGESSMR